MSRTGAGHEEQPPVPGEVGGTLDEQQRGDEHADADDAPRGLEAGQSVVEAGDHHEPDAVEQCGQGEHRAVGTACDEAHDDVGAQQQAR